MYNDLLLNRIGAAPMDDPDAHVQELIDEIEELKSLLGPEAQKLISDLRPRIVTDDVYEELDEHSSLGERLADKMSSIAGSWRFIIFFCILMAIWIVINAFLGDKAFDPFPFILLKNKKEENSRKQKKKK